MSASQPLTSPLPVAYGYIRALPGIGIDEVLSLNLELHQFTLAQGLLLDEVFVENRPYRFRAWYQLLACCQFIGVANVVVPSLEHLHPKPELAALLQSGVEQFMHGRVWVVREPAVLAVLDTGDTS